MNYDAIRQCLGDCRFTEHARREMAIDSFGLIRVDDALGALEIGEIIEEYPDDEPYPSCLVLGWTNAGRPLHLVCAPVAVERRLMVITVYQPDPSRWDSEFRRRRKS